MADYTRNEIYHCTDKEYYFYCKGIKVALAEQGIPEEEIETIVAELDKAREMKND